MSQRRQLEKLFYLMLVPSAFTFCIFKVMKSRKTGDESLALHLKMIDKKYMKDSQNQNLVHKLEDFKRRLYLISLIEENPQTEEEKQELTNRAILIRNFIKDLGPEIVMLETCQERYNSYLYKAISHPAYETTIADAHKALDVAGKYFGEIEKRQEAKDKLFAISQSLQIDERFQQLIGLDTCTYKLPCNTHMADRLYSITKKRFKAKCKMLDVIEDSELKASQSEEKGSIFEQTEKKTKESKNMQKLENILKEVYEEQEIDEKGRLKSRMKTNISLSKQSHLKTVDNVYDQVIIDEVNEELMKSVQKQTAPVVVLLLRNERIPAFKTMWEKTNFDYYQTQQNKKKQTSVQAAES